MSLHPQVALFAEKLRQIEELMSQDVNTAWPEQIKKCRIAVEQSDAWGVDQFLRFFGGMGSLNDYYVERDGKPMIEETDKLTSLLSEAWTLARDLRRT